MTLAGREAASTGRDGLGMTGWRDDPLAAAARCLLCLRRVLAAIFPANVHVALHPAEVVAKGVPADRIPAWMLWARLPLQPLMMLWAWRATRG
jgi:uncharacterized membrane protein